MQTSPSSQPIGPIPPRLALTPRRFWAFCTLGLLLRLYFCVLLPKNTGDLARHLLYGILVWTDGLAILGVPLTSLPYRYPFLIWDEYAYSYPPLAGFFFILIAGISPTLFFAKFVLTALEALNAWLVWRLTCVRWMALVYWLAPTSLWWASREGQFEPLQNTFALLALLVARTRPGPACAILALAVQTKFVSLALLPWLLWLAWRKSRADGALAAAGYFAAGFAPALAASFFYPAFTGPISAATSLQYNPYYWNVFHPDIFVWNPHWMVAAHALASYAAMGLLLYGFARSRERWAYIPPLLFVVFLKIASWTQFWYWILWPALIVDIPDPKIRRRLWLLYLIVDLCAVVAMVVPKFGELVGMDQVTNLSPFHPVRALPR